MTPDQLALMDRMSKDPYWPHGPYKPGPENAFVFQASTTICARADDDGSWSPGGWGGISYSANADQLWEAWTLWFRSRVPEGEAMTSIEVARRLNADGDTPSRGGA